VSYVSGLQQNRIRAASFLNNQVMWAAPPDYLDRVFIFMLLGCCVYPVCRISIVQIPSGPNMTMPASRTRYPLQHNKCEDNNERISGSFDILTCSLSERNVSSLISLLATIIILLSHGTRNLTWNKQDYDNNTLKYRFFTFANSISRPDWLSGNCTNLSTR